MAEDDMLISEFLLNGKKNGLNEDLLREVFEYLNSNRFLPAGEREHVRSQLLKIIRSKVR